MREMMLWQRLHHENVLPFLGIYAGLSEFPALVSPWCMKGDICKYLKDQKQRTDIQQLRITLVRVGEFCVTLWLNSLEMQLEQVLRGLDDCTRRAAVSQFSDIITLHNLKHQVVHGDLKGVCEHPFAG